jgi:murein DD-endopeptidase MepM/ murein hydrolase activator NlpD
VTSSETAAPPGPSPTALATSTTNNGGPELHGFVMPIAGSCLPTQDTLMPNWTRSYRQGTHEGVDLYQADNCVPIEKGTPVVAMKAGRVIRADLDYKDLTTETLARYLANPQTEEALDQFRGRQVWIDHGGGVVTRYCHLGGIAAGITQGSQVSAGQLIAYVGESGTPESVNAPGTQYHLHFEVRVGATYLGRDLPIEEVRRLYQALFSP